MDVDASFVPDDANAIACQIALTSMHVAHWFIIFIPIGTIPALARRKSVKENNLAISTEKEAKTAHIFCRIFFKLHA